jgi:hypothetical protein
MDALVLLVESCYNDHVVAPRSGGVVQRWAQRPIGNAPQPPQKMGKADVAGACRCYGPLLIFGATLPGQGYNPCPIIIKMICLLHQQEGWWRKETFTHNGIGFTS